MGFGSLCHLLHKVWDVYKKQQLLILKALFTGTSACLLKLNTLTSVLAGTPFRYSDLSTKIPEIYFAFQSRQELVGFDSFGSCLHSCKAWRQPVLPACRRCSLGGWSHEFCPYSPASHSTVKLPVSPRVSHPAWLAAPSPQGSSKLSGFRGRVC